MPTSTIDVAPTLLLPESGLVVVNFSSPHPFNFEGGVNLDACSPERAKALSLGSKDLVTDETLPSGKVYSKVTKVFDLTEAILSECRAFQDDPEVDIVLIPFPMLQCLQQQGDARFTKFCTIFVQDRVTKAISQSKFCR